MIGNAKRLKRLTSNNSKHSRRGRKKRKKQQLCSLRSQGPKPFSRRRPKSTTQKKGKMTNCRMWTSDKKRKRTKARSETHRCQFRTHRCRARKHRSGRVPAVARNPATDARDPATIRGDDDTSTSPRGGGSKTRTCSEDIKTREKPSKTAATGSREHGAGGTGTARAATGSQEHGAGSRRTGTGR
jgi:hypothetical protein